MTTTLTQKAMRKGTRTRLPENVPVAIDDIRDVLVIRERDIFLLTDNNGNVPRESIEVRRQRVIDSVLEETLHVTNFNVFPVTLDLCYQFDTDFADIFEVRGLSRPRRGKSHPPPVDGDL